jgi:Ca2+-binding EF-hand superfamily protein
LFFKYDLDRDGLLNIKELTNLLREDLGLNTEEAELYMYLLDNDGTNLISFEEFCFWVRSNERFTCITDKTRFYYLQKALDTFKIYDWDENHALSRKEFQKMYYDFGGNDNEMETSFRALDLDDNGVISFPEYLRWLNWVNLDEIFC